MTREQQSAVFEQSILDHAAILHHAVNAFAEGADRDDLMQEVLLSVWRAIPGFRGDAAPTTYLYRIAHNAAMTWRRRQTHHKRADEAIRDAPPAARPNPQVERLYEAIRSLPPLDRSLLLLYLDEVSYREMSEIHGISESLVGVRLSRARTKLMEQLKEDRNGSE